MKEFIEIEETLIQQRKEGVAIGHIDMVIFTNKITSLRPIQLPSSLKRGDGSPALMPGTSINLSGDQVLVRRGVDEVPSGIGKE